MNEECRVHCLATVDDRYKKRTVLNSNWENERLELGHNKKPMPLKQSVERTLLFSKLCGRLATSGLAEGTHVLHR